MFRGAHVGPRQQHLGRHFGGDVDDDVLLGEAPPGGQVRRLLAHQQHERVFRRRAAAFQVGQFGARQFIGAVGREEIQIAGEADVAPARDQLARFLARLDAFRA